MAQRSHILITAALAGAQPALAQPANTQSNNQIPPARAESADLSSNLKQGLLLLPTLTAETAPRRSLDDILEQNDEQGAETIDTSALLGGIDDDRPLDFEHGADTEQDPRDRRDPLRPRRGGDIDFLESDAGDFSLGFGLTRAGRASAREKDRPLASMESRELTVTGADGPVQMLDAGFGWRFRPDRDVTLSLESGLRTLTKGGPDAEQSSADLGHEPIFLPVIGAALRWDLISGLQFEGRATGHMDDRRGTFVDVFAEARIDLTRSTDLVAGYRFLDASFESDTSRAKLSQDAVYAGIRIRY
jgi:hypothetical protein